MSDTCNIYKRKALFSLTFTTHRQLTPTQDGMAQVPGRREATHGMMEMKQNIKEGAPKRDKLTQGTCPSDHMPQCPSLFQINPTF